RSLAARTDEQVLFKPAHLRMEIAVDELFTFSGAIDCPLDRHRPLRRPRLEGDRVHTLVQCRQRPLRMLDVVDDPEPVEPGPLAPEFELQAIIVAALNRRTEIEFL